MATVSVLNTDAQLSGKTILLAEAAQTVTGLTTFDRDPSAPFAVSANSAVVTNLNADLLDGVEGSAFGLLASSNTWTGSLNTFSGVGGCTFTTSALFQATVTHSARLDITAANVLRVYRSDNTRSSDHGHDNAAAYWQVGNAADNFELRNASGVCNVQFLHTGVVAIRDGITAPSALTGFAVVYVDTADGDYKIKFADGVTKTIATDT